MELNKDCVRDILLECEKLLQMNNDGTMNVLNSSILKEALPQYEESVLKYTVLKMDEAGLLNASIVEADNALVYEFLVSDISYYGHEFLDQIKNDNNWNRVKDIAKNVGALSIDVLQQIAVGVITTQINKFM